MGSAKYYNQKDRDQFHEGWFGQTGEEMRQREKDGSLTLMGIHNKQPNAFEPNTARSSMPIGKTPEAFATVAPVPTLLSRPPGQPATSRRRPWGFWSSAGPAPPASVAD